MGDVVWFVRSVVLDDSAMPVLVPARCDPLRTITSTNKRKEAVCVCGVCVCVCVGACACAAYNKYNLEDSGLKLKRDCIFCNY